jgi:hypothetical protein
LGREREQVEKNLEEGRMLLRAADRVFFLLEGLEREGSKGDTQGDLGKEKAKEKERREKDFGVEIKAKPISKPPEAVLLQESNEAGNGTQPQPEPEPQTEKLDKTNNEDRLEKIDLDLDISDKTTVPVSSENDRKEAAAPAAREKEQEKEIVSAPGNSSGVEQTQTGSEVQDR